MELAQLLESEGFDPDEPKPLLAWALSRSDELVLELGDDPDAAPLLELLGDGVPEPGTRPNRSSRRLSRPPPLSAAELPPPPEQPELVAGQDQPMLEAFDTVSGAIALESELEPLLEPVAESEEDPGGMELHARRIASVETVIDRAPHHHGLERSQEDQNEHENENEDEGEGEDELEELEFDELVEIDDEELEMLEDDDDDELTAAATPPPPPPDSHESTGDAALDDVPVRSGDTATGLPVITEQPGPVQTGATASFPSLAADLEADLAADSEASLDTGLDTGLDTNLDTGLDTNPDTNPDDELEASGEWERAIAQAQAEPDTNSDANSDTNPDDELEASGEWERAIAEAQADPTDTSGEWERAIAAARDGEEDSAVPVQTGDTATHPILGDLDAGAGPVQTGHTAPHPIVSPDDNPAEDPEDELEDVDLDRALGLTGSDEFELDFED